MSIGAISTVVCSVEIGKYAMVEAESVVYRNLAKLKSFVCYCSRKLERVVERGRYSIIYTCNNC